jgi:tetratricopeptide (TPR) repeat protein
MNFKSVLKGMLLMATLSSFIAAHAQSSTDPFVGLTPEQREKLERIGELATKGDDLMEVEKYTEAAEQYRAALALDPENRGLAYCLGRAYAVLGRTKEAITLYRRALKWRPDRGDLDADFMGKPSGMAMHYAVLLARDGQSEAAKAMYYFGLRNLATPTFGLSNEPMPLLVAFDPDPDAEVWTYSSQKLEAAANMALAIWGSDPIDTTSECLARARDLAPEWWYPYFYSAFIDPKSPNAEADFDRAESLVGSEGRRTVLRKLREWKLELRPMPDYPRGDVIRRKIRLLDEAREKLRTFHSFASD